MTEEVKTPEKKPDPIVVIVAFVKDFVTGKVRNLIYAGLTIAGTWGWAMYQKKVEQINLIASMPEKYDRLLEHRHIDSLKAISHMREDSLNDVRLNAKIALTQHKLDSVISLEAEDWKYINKIASQLNIPLP